MKVRITEIGPMQLQRIKLCDDPEVINTLGVSVNGLMLLKGKLWKACFIDNGIEFSIDEGVDNETR